MGYSAKCKTEYASFRFPNGNILSYTAGPAAAVSHPSMHTLGLCSTPCVRTTQMGHWLNHI